ncbi:MAG: hypothetical protein ACXWOL_15600, partial [Ktedonobacteraceae bacterium]
GQAGRRDAICFGKVGKKRFSDLQTDMEVTPQPVTSLQNKARKKASNLGGERWMLTGVMRVNRLTSHMGSANPSSHNLQKAQQLLFASPGRYSSISIFWMVLSVVRPSTLRLEINEVDCEGLFL